MRGECPQSFGLNIAVMAGLPAKVIAAAKIRSDTFIANLRGVKTLKFIQKEIAVNAIHLQVDSDEEMPILELERMLES